MKSAVIQYNNFVLIFILFSKRVKIQLKSICVAPGHFQQEAIARYRGERPKEIRVLKYLLKSTDWLYASCSQPSTIFGM